MPSLSDATIFKSYLIARLKATVYNFLNIRSMNVKILLPMAQTDD
jgi:hypothetical protein